MLILIGFVLAALAAVLVLRGGKGSPAIYNKFGLSVDEFKLISTDLGGQKTRLFLSSRGVQGVPDAVFNSRRKKELVVGEFKSRKGRKYVRYNEFYQIILYMGHLLERYPDYEIKGVIAFADSTTVIRYDEAVYQELINMRNEMRTVLYRKKIADSRPLQARMRVTTQNPKVRFRVN